MIAGFPMCHERHLDLSQCYSLQSRAGRTGCFLQFPQGCEITSGPDSPQSYSKPHDYVMNFQDLVLWGLYVLNIQTIKILLSKKVLGEERIH